MSFAPGDLVGSIVPLVTPFTPSGRVDDDAVARLVDWQIGQGSHGISVTGTTGEPSSLSPDERARLIQLAGSCVASRVPYVPATGTNELESTLSLTRTAERAGADAVLVVVPYYNRPSQEGLFRYFVRVAGAADLPVIVYNIPGRTAVNMTPETMARLRGAAPNVIGVKESNKDFEHVSMVLRRCGRDFRVYSGIELLCYPMLAIGAVGYVSATANVLPARVAALYDRWAGGDVAGAADLHHELIDMNEALFLETNPGPLKWVMGEMGLIDGGCRLPLCEPAPAVRERLAAVMRTYGLTAAEPAEAAR